MTPAVANLAYRFVAMALMLAEANFFCDTAGLPRAKLLDESDVRSGSYVGPPNLKEFMGSIFTDQYFFGFGGGHLANFYERGFMPKSNDAAIRARNLEIAKLS